MEIQEQRSKPKVLKVDSEEAWNTLIKEASNQGRSVFVHFGASWCVPSLSMNSYFEELANDYQSVVFLSVDVDDVKGVASKMEVKAMPTFVLMRDGTAVDRLVGANPEELRRRLQMHLSRF